MTLGLNNSNSKEDVGHMQRQCHMRTQQEDSRLCAEEGGGLGRNLPGWHPGLSLPTIELWVNFCHCSPHSETFCYYLSRLTHLHEELIPSRKLRPWYTQHSKSIYNMRMGREEANHWGWLGGNELGLLCRLAAKMQWNRAENVSDLHSFTGWCDTVCVR